MASRSKKEVPALPAPRLLNVQQAAAFLGTTVWFMRKAAWEKRIPYLHLGQRLLFDVRDLENLITGEKIPAQAA